MKQIYKISLTILVLFIGIFYAKASDFVVNGLSFSFEPNKDAVSVSRNAIDLPITGEINIPSSVIYDNIEYPVIGIQMEAFSNYPELTSVFIPASIIKIESNPFYGCESLIRIDVSTDNPNFSSINGILCNKAKNELKAWPGGIETVNIPSSIKTIGKNSFSHCNSIKELIIGGNINKIDSYAFEHCDQLVSVTINNPVETLEVGAFSECKELNYVSLANSVKKIMGHAFSGCVSLTYIPIPNSVTLIGNYAFYGCSALTAIVFPDSMKSINKWSFKNCSSLKSITFPNSITTIEEEAFDGCQSLSTVNLSQYIKNIGLGAFQNCSSLQSIEVSSENKQYCSVNGILYDKEIQTLIQCPGGINEIVFPESVRILGNSSFRGCINFTSLAIPDFILEIKDKAFYDCKKIETVTLPNSLSKISNSLFRGCALLQEISIPNLVVSIESYAFLDCKSLKYIEIGENINIIETGAFENAESLYSVVCKSLNPPSFGNYSDNGKNCFKNIPQNSILYVYSYVIPYYQVSAWNNIFSQILPIEGGINSIDEIDNNINSLIKVYDLSGRKVSNNININSLHNLPKGIYIVVSNGKRYKISI